MSRVSHTLALLFACAAGVSAVSPLCAANLPGRWRGYSQWQPLSERYEFAWVDADAGTFNVSFIGTGSWTTALGQVSADEQSATAYFPGKHVWLGGELSYGCQYVSWNNTSEWTRDLPIEDVHLIFASHLDVGFTNLILNSFNQYFQEYYPRAWALSDALRNTSTPFTYMTHPILLSLYFNCPSDFTLSNVTLQCPTPAAQQEMKQRIQSGDIWFHRAPMNIEYEVVYNAATAAPFFTLAADLANQLGVPVPAVASVRDVPGVTRAIVPILAAAGAIGLSEGVNPETLPGNVNTPAVWLDVESNTSILYVQHNWGYGSSASRATPTPTRSAVFERQVGDSNCQFVPGLGHALCFNFRGETQGPPDNTQEVVQTYQAFAAEFPNATVHLSTFDRYFATLVNASAMLPVITSEIGDTWINGVACDPQKMSFYREAARAYTDCVASAQCDPVNDPRIKDFNRYFLKTPEHTWGMHSLSDQSSWTNEALQAAISKGVPEFLAAINSWYEQRNFSAVYGMRALADHPLAANITARMAAWTPTVPAPGNDPSYTPISPDQWGMVTATTTPGNSAVGTVTLAFDSATGGITTLDMGSVVSLATATNKLGVLMYRSYNDSDWNNIGNCPAAYPHPGERVANPNSTATNATLVAMWAQGGGMQAAAAAPRSFILQLQLPQELVQNVGAPAQVYVNVTITADAQILFDVQLFNKTATRLGEAIAYIFDFPPQPTFPPAAAAGAAGPRWMMSKIGSWLDPLDVVENGGVRQHSVGQGVAYYDPSAGVRPAAGAPGIFLDTVDAPIMAPAVGSEWETLPVHTTPPQGGPISGWVSVQFTNAWIMNYALWSIDADMRFRYVLRLQM